MKVEDALFHAVHDYEGGAAALAVRMGLGVSTLYSMANPRDVAHEWPLKRFRQVVAFTGDMRPIHALCEENGGVFLPVAESSADLPGALQQMVNLCAECGVVARGVADAIKDGRVTQAELAAIETHIFQMIALGAQLGRQLRADSERKPALKVAR